jgi:hypothetical protein
MAFTNKGAFRILEAIFNGGTLPTNFYVILLTSASAPTVDSNVVSDHTEIAAGNGYATGGFQLTPNATDFDNLTESDASDRSSIQIKDVAWTASGGPIPASGNGARYAALTDDNATIADREIWGWFDLSADRTVSADQSLTLQDCEMRLSTV